jgi:hypothetical protein
MKTSLGSRGLHFEFLNGNFFPHRIPFANRYPLITGQTLNFLGPQSNPVFFNSGYRSPYSNKTGGRLFFWGLPSFLETFSFKNQKKIITTIINNFTYPLDWIHARPKKWTVSPKVKELPIYLQIKNRQKKPVKEFGVITTQENPLQILTRFSFEIAAFESKTIEIKLPLSKLTKNPRIFLIRPENNENFQTLEFYISIEKESEPTSNKNLVVQKNGLEKGYSKKKKFLLGCNYYPSSNYDRFWLKPNFSEIWQDLQKMKKIGLTMIRIHYVHPNWYRDYFPHISEQKIESTTLFEQNFLDRVSILLQMCQKLDLILCLDIFTLVGKNMGSIPGWMNDPSRYKNLIKFQTKIFS